MRRETYLGSVFVDVRRHIGDDARLIRTHGLNNIEDSRVDLPKDYR